MTRPVSWKLVLGLLCASACSGPGASTSTTATTLGSTTSFTALGTAGPGSTGASQTAGGSGSHGTSSGASIGTTASASDIGTAGASTTAAATSSTGGAASSLTETGSSTGSTGATASSTGGTTSTTYAACPAPSGTTGNAGTCGESNFTTPCTDVNGETDYCPADSACGSDGSCACPVGYSAIDCSGDFCSDSNPCSYPNWWCAPDPVPSSAGSFSDGSCVTCELGGSCDNGGTCIPVRPGSTLGICALACDSTSLTCADANSTCVDPGDNLSLCYPWACLGLGQAAPSCGLPHEPWPQVPNQGSPGVGALSALLISYSPWDGGGSYPYGSQLEVWAQSVLTSSYPTAAAGEYGVTSSSYMGALHLTSVPPVVLYDSDIQNAVSTLVTGGTLTPNTGTVLVFLLPAATTFYRGSDNSGELCTDLVAYHSSTSVNGQNILYAVIADCGAATLFGLTDLPSIMSTASHEILEAATDPVNEDGWAYPYPFPHQDPWANMGGEIGDMCDWVTEVVDSSGDLVQRVFSDSLASSGGDPCSPAVGMPAAAVTSLPYSVFSTPGASVTVPLIGWSTDPTAVPWIQLAYLGDVAEPVPQSLPLNGLVSVTLTAPSSSEAFLIKLVASAPGATLTEWPIYVEAF